MFGSGALPQVIVKELPPELLHKKLRFPHLPQEVLLTHGTSRCLASHVLALLETTASNITVFHDGTSQSEDVPHVKGELRNAEACKRAVRGKQIVFHAGLPCSSASPDELRAFVEGTETLLKAAAAAGVKRFVFASLAR
jgi:UDP-glucose 4-epimerase